jgi:hypothetical protein
MVDRDVFLSDTLSAHFMIPPAVGQLAALGVLDDVLAPGRWSARRSRMTGTFARCARRPRWPA